MNTVRTCLRGMYSEYGNRGLHSSANLSGAMDMPPEAVSLNGAVGDALAPASLNSTLNSTATANMSQSDGKQVAQALRMELERMVWKHQAETQELQFNHELSFKEFKASQDVKAAKVSTEIF